MQVTFKLFANLQDYLPAHALKTNALALDVADGTTVQEIIARFALPEKSCHLVLVDGTFVAPGARATRALRDGETLAIWPPVAGG